MGFKSLQWKCRRHYSTVQWISSSYSYVFTPYSHNSWGHKKLFRAARIKGRTWSAPPQQGAPKAFSMRDSPYPEWHLFLWIWGRPGTTLLPFTLYFCDGHFTFNTYSAPPLLSGTKKSLITSSVPAPGIITKPFMHCAGNAQNSSWNTRPTENAVKEK